MVVQTKSVIVRERAQNVSLSFNEEVSKLPLLAHDNLTSIYT